MQMYSSIGMSDDRSSRDRKGKIIFSLLSPIVLLLCI